MLSSQTTAFGRLRRVVRRTLPWSAADRRTAADYRIASRIADLLGQVEFPDVDSVSFYVRNESVLVSGTVHSDAERDMVTGFVGRVPGVRRVVSRIAVEEHGQTHGES